MTNEELKNRGLKPLEKETSPEVSPNNPITSSFLQKKADNTVVGNYVDNIFSKAELNDYGFEKVTPMDYQGDLSYTPQEYALAKLYEDTTGNNSDRLSKGVFDVFSSNEEYTTIPEGKELVTPKLHPDIHASYYSGWESLRNESKEFLLNKYPKLATASPKVKDAYLKKIVIDDILSNSRTATESYADKWKLMQNDPSVTWDQYDSIFNAFYDSHKNKIAPVQDKSFGANPMVVAAGRGLRSEDFNINYQDELSEYDNIAYTGRKITREKYRELEKGVQANKDAKLTPMREQILNQYNQSSDVEKAINREHIQEISSEVSKMHYDHFKDTNKVKMNDEDWDNLYVDFVSNSQVYGNDYAVKRLQDYWQDHVANNQGFWERTGKVAGSTAMNVGGDIAMTAGILLGAIYQTGLAISPWHDADITKVIENDITKYAELAMATGSLNSAKQREYAKYGINALASLNTVDQDYSYIDLNTLAEVIPQAGHVIGFTAGSKITAKALGGAAKLIGKGVTNMADITRLSNSARGANLVGKINQGLQTAAAFNTFAVTTGSEATMEGLAAKRAVLQYGEEQKEITTDRFLKNKLTELISANPEYYATLYLQENPNAEPLGTMQYSKVGERDVYNRVYSEKDINTLVSIFAKNPNVREQFKVEYADELNQIDALAEQSANKALGTTFATDMVLGMVTNGVLQVALNAAPVRKMLSGKKAPNKLFEGLDLTISNNNIVATPQAVTRGYMTRQAIENIFGQSVEEYGQTINQTVGEAFGKSVLNQYLNDKYKNGNIASAVEYDLGTAIIESVNAGLDAATSREAIQSALYGVLTMMVPRVTTHMPDMSARGEGESRWQSIKRRNPFGIEHPGLDIYDPERSSEYQQRQELANYVTEVFSNPARMDSFLSASANVQHIKDYQEAVARGDEKAIRDAQTSLFLDTVTFVATNSESDAGKQLVDILRRRAAFNPDNLDDPESSESKVLDEFYSNPDNKGIKRTDAIKSIASSAKATLDMISRVDDISEQFYEIFGRVEDPDVHAAYVRQVLTLEDKQKRLRDIHTEVKNKAKVSSSKRSGLSSESKAFLAEYGSVENAEETLRQLRASIPTEIKRLQREKVDEKQIAKFRKSLYKQVSQLDAAIDAYHREAKNIPVEDRVISAEEILEMDPSVRGQFMNTEHQSKEQKKVVNSLNKHVRQLLADEYRLSTDVAELESRHRTLIANPEITMGFFSREKGKALVDRASFKYNYLVRDGITYEEMFNEFTSAYENAETGIERNAIANVLMRNPLGFKVLSETRNFSSEQRAIMQTEAWKNLDKSMQANINAVLNYMYHNHIAPNNKITSEDLIDLIKSISDEEFTEALNREGFVGEYARKDAVSIAEKMKGIFELREQQINQVTENTREINAAPASPSSSPAPTPTEDATTPSLPIWNAGEPYELLNTTNPELSDKVNQFIGAHNIGDKIHPSIKTKNTVTFYTPEVLRGEGVRGTNPVVALVVDDSGTIELNGVKYRAIGIIPSDANFDVDLNNNSTENIFYTTQGVIDIVKAPSINENNRQPAHRSIISMSKDALNMIHPTGDNKKGLVISIPRGKGNTGTLDFPVHIGYTNEVKNSKGKTLTQTVKEAHDNIDNITEEEAKEILDFNSYTDALYKLFQRCDTGVQFLDKLFNKEFNKIFYFSSAGKDSSFVVKDGSIELKIGDESIKVLDATSNITAKDVIKFLYNVMYDNGNLVTDPITKASYLLYQVDYKDRDSIERAYKDGVLTTALESLEYVNPTISIRRVSPAGRTQSNNVEDNAIPVSSSSSAVETAEGTQVDTDTGASITSNSTPPPSPSSVSQSAEEILIEESDEQFFDELELESVSRPRRVKTVKDYYRNKEIQGPRKADFDANVATAKKNFLQYALPQFSHKYKEDAQATLSRLLAKAPKDVIKRAEVVLKNNRWIIETEFYTFEEQLEKELKEFDTWSNDSINVEIKRIIKEENEDFQLDKKAAKLIESIEKSDLYRRYDDLLSSPVNKQLNELLTSILERYGFSVIEQDLRDIYGDNVVGVMNFAHKLVLLSQNKSKELTMPEEFSHAMVRIAEAHPEVEELFALTSLFESIKDTTLYKEVYEEYKDEYTIENKEVDEERVAREALGKALATVLTTEYKEKYSSDANFFSKAKNALRKVANYFKSLINNVKKDAFIDAVLYNKLAKISNYLLQDNVDLSHKVDTYVSTAEIMRSLGAKKGQEYQMSEAEVRLQQAKDNLINQARGANIPLRYLNNQIREEISNMGITEQQWTNLPRELQETIIKCRARY